MRTKEFFRLLKIPSFENPLKQLGLNKNEGLTQEQPCLFPFSYGSSKLKFSMMQQI